MPKLANFAGFTLILSIFAISLASSLYDCSLCSIYGPFASVLTSLISPPLSLIFHSSFNDLPALSKEAYYPLYLFSMTLFLLWFLLHHRKRIPLRHHDNWLIILLVFTSTWGLLVSIFNDSTGIAIQDPNRPYYYVYIFFLFSSVSGYLLGIYTSTTTYPHATWVYRTALLILLMYLVVFSFQIIYGGTFFRSSVQLAKLAELKQLVEASSIGVPRLTGLYTVPNGGALIFFLLVMILLFRVGYSYKAALISSLALLSISFLAQSKSMLLVAFFFAFLSFFVGRPFLSKFFLFFFGGLFFVFLLAGALGSNLLSTLRFEESSSIRLDFWGYILHNLSWSQWLSGVGYSHWPIMGQASVGYDLPDPHSYILSIPGTLGLPGVVLYLFVAYTLFHSYNSSESALVKFVAATMFFLIFTRDLIAMPVLLGNSGYTLLAWVVLGLLSGSSRRQFSPPSQ